MKHLPSNTTIIMAHTQSGTQYRFREYERGKWEMLRDADKNASAVLPNDKWLKISMLPVIEQGRIMRFQLQDSQKWVFTTAVTFVGRNG